MTALPAIDRRAPDPSPTNSSREPGDPSASPPLHRRSGHIAWYIAESAVLFVLGAALMHFAYSGAGSVPTRDIGVPGHDSFYHVKMAELLREHGVLRDFPWLRFVYFTQDGPDFVSHHFGFHLLLAPFVALSQSLTGDALTGGRWATQAFFGLMLVVFNLLLLERNVPWRPLWILLFLFLPYQFFTRHAFVRAITPAMVVMLLTLFFLFRRRPIYTAVCVFAFTHLYLGGVLFAPIVVASYVFACAIGPTEQRTIPWKLLIASVIGWLAGVLTYPYASGTLEFLKLQVFGSGLSPDIGVGQEWYPYENVWWFAQMCGPILGIWVATLCLRLRFGPTIDAREGALILLTIAFLILNLKARRFIEYWPLFALAGSAYLAAPLIHSASSNATTDERGDRPRGWPDVVVGVACLAGAALLIIAARRIDRVRDVMSWWPVFAAIAAAYTLVWAIPRWRDMLPIARTPWRVRTIGLASLLFLSGAVFAAPSWHYIRRDCRCQYDLPVIRELMEFLKQHSQPGDVVFTDDWDIFPVFFFHNTHNHYIVGLDPKFTQGRRPELWERYVRISRGQVPIDTTYKARDPSGRMIEHPIHVRLEDIREHFGARFVITDSDHKAFAARLAAARHFTRLIYPSSDYAAEKDRPFLLFEVLPQAESNKQESSFSVGGQSLYLTSYRPVRVEQGWGDLAFDQSVTGGPLLLGSTPWSRGLGTHAPSTIDYRIPDGFDLFQAVVGIDHGAEGRGSVIASVMLDDVVVFESPLLTGRSDHVEVRVELRGARRLRLRADPTPDGNRFDHLNWADAKLVRTRGTTNP